MPRPPRSKPPPGRPRSVAKRVWASLERKPGEVAAEVRLDAERDDSKRVKHWVALVDRAKTPLNLVAADTTAGLSSDTRKSVDTAPTTCSNARRLGAMTAISRPDGVDRHPRALWSATQQ